MSAGSTTTPSSSCASRAAAANDRLAGLDVAGRRGRPVPRLERRARPAQLQQHLEVGALTAGQQQVGGRDHREAGHGAEPSRLGEWRVTGLPPATRCRSSRSSVRRRSGKSDLALDLAEALGGEVVNTDAMQLYRGMDIGTAKLPVEQRRGIAPPPARRPRRAPRPRPSRSSRRWARAAVADCRARGVVPVLVGGSALYTRAVLDRFDFPGTDAGAAGAAGGRARRGRGAGAAPPARRAPTPPPPRRSCRATGGGWCARSRSSSSPAGRSAPPCPPGSTSTRRPSRSASTARRPVVDDRIDRRVRRMWAPGSSTRSGRSSAQGLRDGPDREPGARLPAGARRTSPGSCTEEEACEATVTGTRRFARKQDTWFRKDPRITWVGHDDPRAGARAARRGRPRAPAARQALSRSAGGPGTSRQQHTAASQSVQQ